MAKKRRTATEQAQGIVKDLRRARTTFIQEGDEHMAEAMHEHEKEVQASLDSSEKAAQPKARPETPPPPPS